MLILRKILFYVFLAVYLVVCPVVILYSLGYIYTPKSEEGIVKTGLIHLETFPPGASVFLNKRLLQEKTPCTITELLPGRYQVRVQLKDNRIWEKKIEVMAGKASVFDKILLLPKNLPKSVLLPRPFKDLVRVPATRFLLLIGSGLIGDTTVFDWKGGDVRRFKDPENARFFNETIEKIFVMRGSSYVLIRTRNGRYLGCDLRDGDLKITDLTGFFRKEVPSDIQWEGGHPEYLFPFYDGAIDRIDLGKQKVTSEFIGDVRGFGVSRGRLYALQDQSLTRLSFSSNQRSPEVIDEGRFLKELFHEKDRYRMDFFRNDTVLFSGARGSLLANFLPYRFVEKGMAGYVPDTSLRKMLVWTRKELGFLDLEKKAPAKALFERGPEIDWFYDQGQDIRQSCFVHGDSHVLFSDEDRICLMPTGDPSALPFEIAGILKDSGVFYSERTGKVYFLDRETGYFSSVEILPEETILAKMFPEIEKTEEEGPEA